MPITIRRIVLGPDAEDRFWCKVRQLEDCWEWVGSRLPAGYGVFYTGGSPRVARAHRVAYALTRGEPDTSLELDHLCRNRWCVNPWHLEAVPHRINVRRGNAPMALNARMTHCKNGHEFRPETTYTPPSRPTSRICKLCPNYLSKNQRWQENRRRKRLARQAAA